MFRIFERSIANPVKIKDFEEIRQRLLKKPEAVLYDGSQKRDKKHEE